MQYQCNNTFNRGDYNYNLSEIISEEEYESLPERYKKWFSIVGKPLHFYCQNVAGDVDFSIEEWNEVYKSVQGLSKKDQRKILDPRPPCEKQCFACMAIVGEQRLKTKSLK